MIFSNIQVTVIRDKVVVRYDNFVFLVIWENFDLTVALFLILEMQMACLLGVSDRPICKSPSYIFADCLY